MKHRILVIDDEQNARDALKTILTEEGYEVGEAGDGEAGLAALSSFRPDAVLCDIRMPKMDGLTLLARARADGHTCTFVMVTAFASIETAVQAMKAGAEDYVTKPVDVSSVLAKLEKVLEKKALKQENEQLRERLREKHKFSNIVGESNELQSVFDVVARAAPTRATILVLGESGTGKELIAQAIHEASPRRDKPFIKVNCAALTETLLESELFGHEKGAYTGAVGRREGRFELANGGTLFLDELGDVSPGLQVKLLRVLQQQEFERVGGTQTVKVDVRVVAATNRDLEAEVKAGRFREDLYYRLNVVSVTLPPLRRRKSDIPALVNHFLERYGEVHGKSLKGLAPGTLNALLSYDWPGNVRELGNVIERAVVLARGADLTADDLPIALRGPRPTNRTGDSLIPGATLYDIEREAILRTLELVDGSTSRAADLLGISVRKIQYRLKEYADAQHTPEKPHVN
ncbi:MAG: sigma-54 dependent transcriptional regulator [Archangium sp.]|nr:sigma-54 dependent transcriptional regulator [Archangium sp.]MDP3152694.1 sigma-54 dependent transcriptional regulator [Archangium sp.]MDP3574830.1 sigma-54 dependent transcriptional regulator [Archangium sp.]